MVTGLLYMIKKVMSNNVENSTLNYHKLSIQISLNGLSFCILDTIGNKIEKSERIQFSKELSHFEVQKKLKEVFEKHKVTDISYNEVIVIHRNNLFSFIPSSIFDKNELLSYLKFNAKVLSNDHIAYDEIESYDMINVYVPFVNINDYIHNLFGEFEYLHSGTVMIQSLLSVHSNGNETVCYAHISEQQLDITVISKKKLVLYNSFNLFSKEDLIYYILFTFEQLKLDAESVELRLFGNIKENDEIYDLCYRYINNVSTYIPTNNTVALNQYTRDNTIDFTVLSTL